MSEKEYDDLGRVLTSCQQEFFSNSKIRDENGRLLTMYHGSSYLFDTFDVKKIRGNETDAMYNGFWFSSDPNTLPAWTRLQTRYEVYLNVSNPAPMDVVRSTIKEVRGEWVRSGSSHNVFHPESNTVQDEVRYRLQEKGYDGIIHDWKPEVDVHELMEAGQTAVTSVRGTKYILKKDDEWGGLDLYYYDKDEPDHLGEHLTGYEDLADYMSLQERTVVCFRPEQIKAVTNRFPTNEPNFLVNHSEKESSDNMKGYILTDSYGDDIQVYPRLDIYDSSNGLFIGLQSYDPDLEVLDNYCALTINGDVSLPYLEAAVDTTYNGQEKLAFLVRNGFAQPTGRELPYGGAWYPIFRFNEAWLQEIDPGTFQAYAKLHGMDKLDGRIQEASARSESNHADIKPPEKEQER